MALSFHPIKTKILFPPKDDIFSLFDTDGFNPEDGDLLFLASKCLAIHQGRCVKIGSVNKDKLIADEADEIINKDCIATIKDGVVIAFSGIDESNGNGYYILWPKDVVVLLRQIHQFLCKKFFIKNLGIISLDSKCSPMRKGTVGVAQGIYGFNPVRNCEGNSDIFGRKLQITSVNVADSLSSAACFLMGEGAECQPIVIARGAENIEFGESFSLKNLFISHQLDMFSCFFKH